jgi:hypothetical protein
MATRKTCCPRSAPPGDADFLDFILAAHGAGHVTAEALEREQTHKLIRKAGLAWR